MASGPRRTGIIRPRRRLHSRALRWGRALTGRRGLRLSAHAPVARSPLEAYADALGVHRYPIRSPLWHRGQHARGRHEGRDGPARAWHEGRDGPARAWHEGRDGPARPSPERNAPRVDAPSPRTVGSVADAATGMAARVRPGPIPDRRTWAGAPGATTRSAALFPRPRRDPVPAAATRARARTAVRHEEPAARSARSVAGADARAETAAHVSRRSTPAGRSTRWMAALRGSGQDRPGPFPEWAKPLVRAIVGGSPAPSLAFGVTTRRALARARASGAAWGREVHLPGAPRETPADLELLAHELAHVRQRSVAPNFFEGDTSAPGEREARAFGRSVRRLAERSQPSLPGLAARTAAGITAARGDRRLARPPSRPMSIVPSRPRRGGAVSVQRHALPSAPSLPSVSSLPVGGIGPVMRAFDPAALAQSAADRAPSLLPGGASDAVAAARDAVAAARERTTARARQGASDVADAVSSTAARAGEGLTGALGSAAGAATDPVSQLGDLLEALEERVLVELERRGGRFAGTF